MLPKIFLPKQYSYLKAFEDDDLILMEELQDDCAICMANLRQGSTEEWPEFTDKPAFNYYIKKMKTHYMITPCNHKFHVPCLLNWMIVKMECPSCRGTLPSIF